MEYVSSLFWCVFHERNRRILHGEELDNHKLKQTLITCLMESPELCPRENGASLLDFIDDLTYE